VFQFAFLVQGLYLLQVACFCVFLRLFPFVPVVLRFFLLLRGFFRSLFLFYVNRFFQVEQPELKEAPYRCYSLMEEGRVKKAPNPNLPSDFVSKDRISLRVEVQQTQKHLPTVSWLSEGRRNQKTQFFFCLTAIDGFGMARFSVYLSLSHWPRYRSNVYTV